MNLYCVYDKLASEGGPLFEAKNDAVAWRMIDKFIMEQQRPDEYELFYVGHYCHDPVSLQCYEVRPVPRSAISGVVEDDQNYGEKHMFGVRKEADYGN